MSNPSNARSSGLLERLFRLNEHETSVRQEFFGGLTSFMACCYLIFVIPTMLADAGMDRTAVTGAVVLTTIVVTLIMGLWANYPVVVAPGLGITAFFAYYVCGPAGFSWQAGLGAVLVSGMVFFLLTVTRIRQWIVDSVPKDLKYAIVVGIGTFIAFIGFKNCGIVVSNESTSVALGDLTDPKVLLALFGFFLTAVLNVMGIRAAMIIGILATTALGVVTGHASLPEGSWLSAGFPDISKTFFQLDLQGALSHGLFTIIFSILILIFLYIIFGSKPFLPRIIIKSIVERRTISLKTTETSIGPFRTISSDYITIFIESVGIGCKRCVHIKSIVLSQLHTDVHTQITPRSFLCSHIVRHTHTKLINQAHFL